MATYIYIYKLIYTLYLKRLRVFEGVAIASHIYSCI